MAKNTKFQPGQSGNVETQFQAGNKYRWPPGQSGNRAGISRSRLEFEERFYSSLLDQGSADEAASLLWKCAREHEPWAVQALLQRLAPETKQIKLTQGMDDDADYSQFTDEELDQLEGLLRKTRTETSEDGEGPA
jgi:hypothetical protein